MLFQKVVDWADTGWLYQCADVVQESKKVLPRSEVLLYSLQGGSLTQREQGWHERVALFSAFGLSDSVCFAGCIMPHVLGGFGDGKHWLALWLASGTAWGPRSILFLEMVSYAPMPSTEGTVRWGRNGDAVHNGFGPGPGGQSKLVWGTS